MSTSSMNVSADVFRAKWAVRRWGMPGQRIQVTKVSLKGVSCFLHLSELLCFLAAMMVFFRVGTEMMNPHDHGQKPLTLESMGVKVNLCCFIVVRYLA